MMQTHGRAVASSTVEGRMKRLRFFDERLQRFVFGREPEAGV